MTKLLYPSSTLITAWTWRIVCTWLRTVSGSRRTIWREGRSVSPSAESASSIKPRITLSRCAPSHGWTSNCQAWVSSWRISQGRRSVPLSERSRSIAGDVGFDEVERARLALVRRDLLEGEHRVVLAEHPP